MTVQSVKDYFIAKKKDIEILTFEDTSTVAKAAEELGVSPGEIAKSLLLQVQDDYLMIIMAGDKRLDNRKFKDLFKSKPKMPEFERVVEITGHPVGGVCPFGLKTDVPVYLDKSLQDYSFVYPAAGAPNAAVGLSVDELEKLTNSDWIDVAVNSD